MAEDEKSEEEKLEEMHSKERKDKLSGMLEGFRSGKMEESGIGTQFEAIEQATKKQVKKDNKEAVDQLLNVQQSSASGQAKKSDAPSTPKPVRRIQVENVPPELPERPFPLAKMPTQKATNKTLSFPGASNGVFLLGGTLAIVALWSNVINPLLDIGWNGFASSKRVTMPASGIISLVLFILLITFISTLSPEFANVSFLFILGLWVVYLVMNPTVVQKVASYVSQGNASTTPATPPNNPDFTGATPPKKQN